MRWLAYVLIAVLMTLQVLAAYNYESVQEYKKLKESRFLRMQETSDKIYDDMASVWKRMASKANLVRKSKETYQDTIHDKQREWYESKKADSKEVVKANDVKTVQRTLSDKIEDTFEAESAQRILNEDRRTTKVYKPLTSPQVRSKLLKKKLDIPQTRDESWINYVQKENIGTSPTKNILWEKARQQKITKAEKAAIEMEQRNKRPVEMKQTRIDESKVYQRKVNDHVTDFYKEATPQRTLSEEWGDY